MTGDDAPRTDPCRTTTWPALPGAPESRLSAVVAVRPPVAPPAPPWLTRVEATLWAHPAGPEALAALPAALRPRRAVVVGAVVRYLDSPVGPYEEVVGAVVPSLRQVTVPFLAVSSLASVAGGRAHWALPKTLGTFHDGGAGDVARADDWSVAAVVRPAGLRLPLGGWLRLCQVDADGAVRRAGVVTWGRVRAARVQVDVRSAYAGEPGSISDLLRTGHHLGAVLQGRVRIGRPRQLKVRVRDVEERARAGVRSRRGAG